jgi:hypothetical protein
VSETPTVTCGDPLYRCRCVKPVGHVDAGDDVHACGEEVCGGSWRWLDEERTRFHPLSYPHGEWRGAVIDPRPDDVTERDGKPFVECDEDGEPHGVFRAKRGGIKYIEPPGGWLL